MKNEKLTVGLKVCYGILLFMYGCAKFSNSMMIYMSLRSVIVYQQGEVIAENYYNSCNENTKHQIKSIWKSIISLCIGSAWIEG